MYSPVEYSPHPLALFLLKKPGTSRETLFFLPILCLRISFAGLLILARSPPMAFPPVTKGVSVIHQAVSGAAFSFSRVAGRIALRRTLVLNILYPNVFTATLTGAVCCLRYSLASLPFENFCEDAALLILCSRYLQSSGLTFFSSDQIRGRRWLFEAGPPFPPTV